MPQPSAPPSSTNRGPRIAIIGGGISGLSAAHRLNEILPGAELELFEHSGRLGGVLNTVERGGFLIEQSADNFLVKPSAGLDLCQKLGLADQLLTTDETRRRAFIVRRGRLIPIPDGFYLMSPRKLWPVLTSPALSLAGKLRLLFEPFVPRRLYAPGDAQGRSDLAEPDESVASFARRRLGREVFERIVQPLVAGIYTADPERLSMAATMPQFAAYERSAGSLLRATLFKSESSAQRSKQPLEETLPGSAAASGARYGLFVAPQRGMTSLVNTLAERLGNCAVHLNTPVKRISRTADGWRVELLHTPAKQSSFDGVIVALPAPAASAVLTSANAQLAKELQRIEYAGCAVISLGFARQQIQHPLNGFGFVVPRAEKRQIIAGSFASLKFTGRAPTDHILVRVFIGGAMQPELLRLSDEELAEIALSELHDLLGIHGQPLIVDVARWPLSMPQYHVGHLNRVARIEALSQGHPAFALAGNAYRGVGIPQCIASGKSAAERVAAGLQKNGPSAI